LLSLSLAFSLSLSFLLFPSLSFSFAHTQCLSPTHTHIQFFKLILILLHINTLILENQVVSRMGLRKNVKVNDYSNDFGLDVPNDHRTFRKHQGYQGKQSLNKPCLTKSNLRKRSKQCLIKPIH
jgi:hypothetical protein